MGENTPGDDPMQAILAALANLNKSFNKAAWNQQAQQTQQQQQPIPTPFTDKGKGLATESHFKSHTPEQVLQDLEQRDNLFHSRCKIQNKVCHLIIDSGSCANIASICLVEKLGLKAQPHPRPYKLKGLNDKEELQVSKQVEISLSIGQYKDQILCDVAPMQAGHVLLGRPWQYDRNVAHNGRTNEYSFSFNHCKFTLAPLPQKEVRILQSRAKGKSSYFAIQEFLNFHPPDIMHLPLPRDCFAGFKEQEIKVQEHIMSNNAENVIYKAGNMMYHKENPPLQKFTPTLELDKAKNISFVQLLEHLKNNHQGKLSDYKHLSNTNLGLFDAGSTVLRTKPLQEGEYDISMDVYTSGANKEHRTRRHEEDNMKLMQAKETCKPSLAQIEAKAYKWDVAICTLFPYPWFYPNGFSRKGFNEANRFTCLKPIQSSNGLNGELRSVIESLRPNQDEPSGKLNCFGFSTHQRSTESWNHDQIHFGLGDMNFTNWVNRSFPDLDLGALNGGFLPNQEELSCKPTCRGFMTHPGSSSNWFHINIGSGLKVIQVARQRIFDLPYLEAFTLWSITVQRLYYQCCCVLVTYSVNLDVPRHHTFTPKLSRLKHYHNLPHLADFLIKSPTALYI